MTNPTDKCKANETSTCCCVDINTVIDNSDCNVPYEAIYTTKEEANDALSRLTRIAHDIESDPCQIAHTLEQVEGGIKLSANFDFCCATESMIFQFKLR